MAESSGAAGAIYAARLAEHRRAADVFHRRHLWLGNVKGLLFLAFLALLWAALAESALLWTWSLVPLAGLVALLPVHESVLRRKARALAAAQWNQAGLERLDHRWAGKGDAGERYADSEHPYQADLDLFGKGSLFERLASTRTRQGADLLAGWLLAPTPAPALAARQQAVRELIPKAEFREDVGLLGSKLPGNIDFAADAAWGAAPARDLGPLPRILATTFSAIAAMMLAIAIPTNENWSWFLLSLLPLVAIAAWRRRETRAVLGDVDRRDRELRLLSELLHRIEREPESSPRLVVIRAALDADGVPPSRQIARLSKLVEILDWRRNQLFAPFAAMFLWSTQLAYAVERWRSRSGPKIRVWLEAAAEIEALHALAGFAFERPDAVFPEIAAAEGGSFVEGTALRHPLLPAAVANDVALGPSAQLYLVSGSNMSGKSTYLRTIGANLVLAYAGAPVAAAALRASPLHIGATLRIHDSLQEGKSRFYAEIVRLRRILDAAIAGPVLFLLDELFHGTNSNDRLVGAVAVLGRLLERKAIGLATTHDLALAEAASRLGGAARNVHFADQFADGEMKFDYRLRDGVVPKSNALALMRAVGIEV